MLDSVTLIRYMTGTVTSCRPGAEGAVPQRSAASARRAGGGSGRRAAARDPTVGPGYRQLLYHRQQPERRLVRSCAADGGIHQRRLAVRRSSCGHERLCGQQRKHRGIRGRFVGCRDVQRVPTGRRRAKSGGFARRSNRRSDSRVHGRFGSKSGDRTNPLRNAPTWTYRNVRKAISSKRLKVISGVCEVFWQQLE